MIGVIRIVGSAREPPRCRLTWRTSRRVPLSSTMVLRPFPAALAEQVMLPRRPRALQRSHHVPVRASARACATRRPHRRVATASLAGPT